MNKTTMVVETLAGSTPYVGGVWVVGGRALEVVSVGRSTPVSRGYYNETEVEVVPHHGPINFGHQGRDVTDPRNSSRNW